MLFVWLLARLAAGDPRALPYSAFLHGDPLSAIGVTLAAGTLPGALVWALVLIALTLVFGRVFCGWICPLGTLQQLSSWLLSPRSRRESLQVNRYRRWYALKTYLLAALLVAALAGTLQSGLLDPLSLTARGLASGLWPVLPGGQAGAGRLAGRRCCCSRSWWPAAGSRACSAAACARSARCWASSRASRSSASTAPATPAPTASCAPSPARAPTSRSATTGSSECHVCLNCLARLPRERDELPRRCRRCRRPRPSPTSRAATCSAPCWARSPSRRCCAPPAAGATPRGRA